MKAYKLYLTILFAASSMTLLSSCENDVYDPNAAESTKDLIAPSDFDWDMTRSVTCSLTSPVNTVVSIYSDAACTDESLLVEGIALTANETKEIPIYIPAYKTNIYVQYPTADGEKVLEGKLNVTTRTKAENIILLLPGDASRKSSPDYHYAYYPSKNTQGTLMFEDLYPELGDYDFNDFVIGYNAEIFTSGTHNATDDGFIFTFKIRAIGGSLPYRPALRLKGFAMKNLRNAEVSFTTTRTGIEMELVKGRSDEQDVIFVINGTEKLRQGGFFNTDPEKPVDTDLPIVTCKVVRNNYNDIEVGKYYSALSAALPNYFDFFLQNTQNKDEIHFKGFNPTDMSQMDPNTEFIHNRQKLVWAIAVPEEIGYAKERIDILHIYRGKFKSWIASSGTSDEGWYLKPPHPDGLFPLNK